MTPTTCCEEFCKGFKLPLAHPLNLAHSFTLLKIHPWQLRESWQNACLEDELPYFLDWFRPFLGPDLQGLLSCNFLYTWKGLKNSALPQCGGYFHPHSGCTQCQPAPTVCWDCMRHLVAAWVPWTINQHLLWLVLTFIYAKLSPFWHSKRTISVPRGFPQNTDIWISVKFPEVGCSFFWLKKAAPGLQNKQEIIIAMKKKNKTKGPVFCQLISS